MVPDVRRRRRAPHRRGTCPIVTPMPELPEVETVARDLRRRLLPEGGGPGPVITGARVAWTRTLRDEDPERSSAGVTGRRIEAIGRRGKQVVVDLVGRRVPHRPPQDDRPAVRRAGVAADRPLRAARAARSTTAASCGSATCASSGGSGCTSRTTTRSTAIGPGAARRPRSRSRRSGRGSAAAAAGSSRCSSTRAFVAGVGNIYADEALWRSKLHPLRSAALAPAARRARPVPPHPRDPRRGDRPPRQLDRRLHGPRRRRRDAGAPRRLPAHRRAVPPLRAADPADRHRHPGDPLLLVVPAPARGAAPRRRDAAAHDDAATRRRRDGRKGRRWVELDGDGALGRTTDEAARGPRPHGAHEGGGRGPPRGGTGRGAAA